MPLLRPSMNGACNSRRCSSDSKDTTCSLQPQYLRVSVLLLVVVPTKLDLPPFRLQGFRILSGPFAVRLLSSQMVFEGGLGIYVQYHH